MDESYKKVLKRRAKAKIEKKEPSLHHKRMSAIKSTRDFVKGEEVLDKRLTEINKKITDSAKEFKSLDKELDNSKVKGGSKYLNLMKKRDEARKEFYELRKENDKIYNEGRANQGVEARGRKVGDKFVKEPIHNETFDSNRFEKKHILSRKGLAPETFQVQTSNKERLVQDVMDTGFSNNPNAMVGESMGLRPTGGLGQLIEDIETGTPMIPEDLYGDNIGRNPKTGNLQAIDSGHFKVKDWDEFEESLDGISKKSITKNSAGKFRRKLPSVLPFIGPAILGASLMASPDANARNEVLTDFADPLGSDVIGGGDLPEEELVKRSNFNRAIKLNNIRKGQEDERRDNSAEPANANPLY